MLLPQISLMISYGVIKKRYIIKEAMLSKGRYFQQKYQRICLYRIKNTIVLTIHFYKFWVYVGLLSPSKFIWEQILPGYKKNNSARWHFIQEIIALKIDFFSGGKKACKGLKKLGDSRNPAHQAAARSILVEMQF